MKKIRRLTMLFMLCLVFTFTGKAVHAASAVSTDRVAYVDSKKLVLRFVPFSSAGYTYTVKGNDKTISKDVAGTVKELSIDISGIYAHDTRYTLELKAKDTGDYINVAYYTGTAISATAIKTDGSTITSSSWTAPKDAGYTGAMLKAATKTGDLNVIATGRVEDKTATKVTAKGQYVAGNYTAYTIFLYGDAYGCGIAKTFKYIPEVKSLKATPNTKRATLTWKSMTGAAKYRIAYKLSTASSYKHVTTTAAKYTQTGLTAGKKYQFKVQAYYDGTWGAYSDEVTCRVPIVPGQVKNVNFSVNDHGKFIVQWDATKNATAYVVYAKKKGESSYTRMGETKLKSYNLSKLSANTSYTVVVYAKKNSYMSDVHSKAISTNPKTFVKKNAQKILMSRVRGIAYKHGKCITTKKKYTKEIKEAYVNYYKIPSKTNYLIYAFLYTQEAAIFKKTGGKWKMIRTFTVASGSYNSRTPRGKFELFKKEKVWKHATNSSWYISHFYKKASFHTRPHWNKGGIQDARIGVPISNACIRCYDEDAIFIYKHIPLKTKVRVR